MSRRFVAASLVAASLAIAQPFSAARQTPTAAPAEDAWRANNIGVAYLEQFKPDEAARSFRRALELDPSLPLARINLAIALFYVPDLTEARTVAEAAAAAAPEAPQPPFVLGLIAKSDNRVDDAVAAFSRVLALDPGDLGARVNLAQLHMQKREYAAAVDLLRPAVAAEPYHVTALYNLGVALTRAGKAEEGQQVMAQFQNRKVNEGKGRPRQAAWSSRSPKTSRRRRRSNSKMSIMAGPGQRRTLGRRAFRSTTKKQTVKTSAISKMLILAEMP